MPALWRKSLVTPLPKTESVEQLSDLKPNSYLYVVKFCLSNCLHTWSESGFA